MVFAKSQSNEQAEIIVCPSCKKKTPITWGKCSWCQVPLSKNTKRDPSEQKKTVETPQKFSKTIPSQKGSQSILCSYEGIERPVHPEVCKWHKAENDPECEKCEPEKRRIH